MKYRFTLVAITIVIICALFWLFTKHSKLKKYNVIFAGTVRNVANHLEKCLHNIDRCGNRFHDYAVIIYENDSTDSTRQILAKHTQERYHYILEDNVKEPKRTVRIANGRNKILEKVSEINRGGKYDFLIMLDMDDINESGKFVDSIESCFKYEGWDVLTGNQTGIYYDLWALRKKHDMEYDCWLKVSQNKQDPTAQYTYVYSKYTNYPQEKNLLPVDSAFGGIAIYKLASLPNHCRYVGSYETGEEKCEHVDFHACIKDNGGRIFINTNFLTS